MEIVSLGIVILGILACWYLPVPGRLIVLIINMIIPDPIPYADEILMTLGNISGIKRKLLDE
jgi:hypothetical protein